MRHGGRAVVGGVGAGFSCGVDSFFARHQRRLRADGARPHRLTHLFVNNAGRLGDSLTELRLSQVRAMIAGARGPSVVHVRCDPTPIHDAAGLPFVQSHTMRNLACALAVPCLLRSDLYLSAYEYRDFSAPVSDIAKLEPALVPPLSTEDTAFLQVGAERSRMDKTRPLATPPEARRYLDVCIAPDARAA